MSYKIKFEETPNLPQNELRELATLAYSAFKDFYKIFTNDDNKVIECIIDQFINYSKLSQKLVCFVNKKIAGLCSYYNVNEMSQRQIAGIRPLLEITEYAVNTNRSLDRYKQNFEDFYSKGMYISRFVINKNLRGSSLASNLLT